MTITGQSVVSPTVGIVRTWGVVHINGFARHNSFQWHANRQSGIESMWIVSRSLDCGSASRHLTATWMLGQEFFLHGAGRRTTRNTEQNPTNPNRCAVIANSKLSSVRDVCQISAVRHGDSPWSSLWFSGLLRATRLRKNEPTRDVHPPRTRETASLPNSGGASSPHRHKIAASVSLLKTTPSRG